MAHSNRALGRAGGQLRADQMREAGEEEGGPPSGKQNSQVSHWNATAVATEEKTSEF